MLSFLEKRGANAMQSRGDFEFFLFEAVSSGHQERVARYLERLPDLYLSAEFCSKVLRTDQLELFKVLLKGGCILAGL